MGKPITVALPEKAMNSPPLPFCCLVFLLMKPPRSLGVKSVHTCVHTNTFNTAAPGSLLPKAKSSEI